MKKSTALASGYPPSNTARNRALAFLAIVAGLTLVTYAAWLLVPGLVFLAGVGLLFFGPVVLLALVFCG